MTIENGDKLIVEAEQEDSNDRWSGEFSSQYLEEITGKTGNFKRFDTFVRMMASALSQKSDSVFVDLLTYQDLERLKARKNGKHPSGLTENSKGSSKRFLILTYLVEFDKVHYPLPLAQETSPNVAALLRTIARLKKELTEAQSRANPEDAAVSMQQETQHEELRKEFKRVVGENEKLKLEVISLTKDSGRQNSKASATWDAGGQREASLRQKISQVEAQLTEERSQHRKLQVRYRREVGRLGAELEREQVAARSLRAKCQELTRKLAAAAVAESHARGRSSSAARRGSNSSTNARRSPSTGRRRKPLVTPDKKDVARPAWGSAGATFVKPENSRVHRAQKNVPEAPYSTRRIHRTEGYDTGYSSANSQGSKASKSSAQSGWSASSKGSARSRASSVHSKLSGHSSASSRRKRDSSKSPASHDVHRGKSRIFPRQRTPSPTVKPKNAMTPPVHPGSGHSRIVGKPRRRHRKTRSTGSNGPLHLSSPSDQDEIRCIPRNKSPSESALLLQAEHTPRRQGLGRIRAENELVSESIIHSGDHRRQMHSNYEAKTQRSSIKQPSFEGSVNKAEPQQYSIKQNSNVTSVLSKPKEDLSTALEISDIDQRLNALQDFLRQAKTGMIS